MAPRTKRGRSKKAQVANAMSVLNSIGSRAQFLQRLAGQAGIQYSGKRDTYATAGYVAPGREKFEDYWGLYQRGDVAGRIVDLPAKTTWRTPPQIIEEGKDKGTAFTKAFDAMAKRLRLWQYFNRVDRLAGVGRYAVLFIGQKGVDDASLKKPLKKASEDSIIYLSVYHEKNAEIAEWVTDIADPRFGMPKTYKLRTGTDAKFKGGTELIVDASRCIHVAEDCLEDDVYGRPRLKRALNRIFDLDKVAASTGEAYWQMAVRILQAKIDPEVEISQTQLKDLDEKLGEMVHDLKRHFYGQGIDLAWLPEGTPNVKQVSDFYFSLVAAAAGIPKRILFGSEVGELASSTDQETYFGMINERQEQFAEPTILRQFIDKMIGITALPSPETKEYQVNWTPLFEESADEKASTSLKVAQTAAALAPVGGAPVALVTIDQEGIVKLIERKQGDALPEGLEAPVDDGGKDEDADEGGLSERDGGNQPAAGGGSEE